LSHYTTTYHRESRVLMYMYNARIIQIEISWHPHILVILKLICACIRVRLISGLLVVRLQYHRIAKPYNHRRVMSILNCIYECSKPQVFARSSMSKGDDEEANFLCGMLGKCGSICRDQKSFGRDKRN